MRFILILSLLILNLFVIHVVSQPPLSLSQSQSQQVNLPTPTAQSTDTTITVQPSNLKLGNSPIIHEVTMEPIKQQQESIIPVKLGEVGKIASVESIPIQRTITKVKFQPIQPPIQQKPLGHIGVSESKQQPVEKEIPVEQTKQEIPIESIKSVGVKESLEQHEKPIAPVKVGHIEGETVKKQRHRLKAIPIENKPIQTQSTAKSSDLKFGTGTGSTVIHPVEESKLEKIQLQQPVVSQKEKKSFTHRFGTGSSSSMMQDETSQVESQSDHSTVSSRDTSGSTRVRGNSQQQQDLSLGVKIVKRNALNLHSQLITSHADLSCPSPSMCGVNENVGLYEAILSHTDLSIPAMHLSMFPFLQPFVELMENAPCNLTAVIPASSNLVRIAKYGVNRYCRDNTRWGQKFGQTNACKTARHMIQLENAIVKNGFKLAESGNEIGKIQLTQMKVLQTLLHRGIEKFLNENSRRSTADVDYCAVSDTTIFLPDVRDFQNLLDFVARKVQRDQEKIQSQQQQQQVQQNENQSQSGEFTPTQPVQKYEPDIEQICQDWNRNRRMDNMKSNMKLGLGSKKQLNGKHSSQSLFRSDSSDSLLVGSESTGAPTSQPIKRGSMNQQQQQQQQQSCPTGAIVGSVECPSPPYQPVEQPTNFPESTQQQEQEQQVEQQIQQPYEEQESQTSEDIRDESEPQLRVRPFTVSAFMQRTITAAISQHFLPFSLITTDMPIHLVAPTLMKDPMFVNLGTGTDLGNIGNINQQQQTQTQNQTQDQPQQQLRMKLGESTSTSSSTRHSSLLPRNLKQRSATLPVTSKRSVHLQSSARSLQHQSMKMALFDFHSKQKSLNRLGESNTDDDQQGENAMENDKDAQIDILLAKIYAVTPQEVEAPYVPSLSNWFRGSGTGTGTDTGTGTSVRAQSIHFEKEENGVYVRWGGPTSVLPAQSKVISPDIQVQNGVIQIVDFPWGPAAKTSKVLKSNGFFGFAALAKSAGRRMRDTMDYASGLTMFVPQDSALVGLVKQLPKRLLSKLVRDVAKYKRKVQKVKQLAQGDRSYHTDTDDQFDAKKSMKPKFGLGRKKMNPSWKMSDRNLKKQHTTFDTSAVGELDQQQQSDDSSSRLSLRRRRSNALADSIQQLRGSPTFDLKAWCKKNQVNFDQQQTRRGEEDQGGTTSGKFSQQLDPSQLSALLESHIFIGVTNSPDFTSGKVFHSINGQSFTMSCGGSGSDNDQGDVRGGSNFGKWIIGSATVLFTDMQTKNGIVHIVDRPLNTGGDDDSSNLSLSTSSPSLVRSKKLNHLIGVNLLQVAEKAKRQIGLKMKSNMNMKKSKSFGSKSDGSSDSLGMKQQSNNLKLRSLKTQHRLNKMKSWKLKGNSGEDDDDDDTGNSSSDDRDDCDPDVDVNCNTDQTGTGSGSDTDNDESDDDINSYRRGRARSFLKGPCLFTTSKQCEIVDTLQMNPQWNSMKNSPSSLFSASNLPESDVCSIDGDQTKSYSRDTFSIPTFQKCYAPDVYQCSQGHLILKDVIKMKQQQQQQSQSQSQSQDAFSKSKKFGFGGGVKLNKNLFGQQEEVESPQWQQKQSFKY